MRNLQFLIIFLFISCNGTPESQSSGESHPSDLPPVATMKVVTKNVMGTSKTKSSKPPVKKNGLNTDKNSILSLDEVKTQLAKFVMIKLDSSGVGLNSREKAVVVKLIEASKLIDKIFFKQVSGRNINISDEIEAEVAKFPEKKPILTYFKINYGPWDRLSNNRPFWTSGKKPSGAGFYDSRMSKNVFSRYLNFLETSMENMGKKQKLAKEIETRRRLQAQYSGLRSPYTIINRKNGEFEYTPYSKAYSIELERVSVLLKEAASLSDDYNLRNYLNLLSSDILKDDFVKSSFAWLNIKGTIEVIIGPYDTYEDKLMGYKTSYESYIAVTDSIYTKKLNNYTVWLKELDRNLPYDKKFRTKYLKLRQLRIVNEIYAAGSAHAGRQKISFDLPGDPVVRDNKRIGGHKLVIFKNISKAKFTHILKPIAQKIINPIQLKYVTFDGFFSHLIYHEVTHSLGPRFVMEGREKVDLRLKLREYSQIIEETKAHMGGLMGIEFMIIKMKKGDDRKLREGYVSFIASIFRLIRFGAKGAYEKGGLISLNYFINEKAVTYDLSTSTYTINFERMKGSVKKLASEVLKIQTTGDYDLARDFCRKWGKKTRLIKRTLEKMETIPVDIYPEFKFVN